MQPSLVPGPFPVFQCGILKVGKGSGDEANAANNFDPKVVVLDRFPCTYYDICRLRLYTKLLATLYTSCYFHKLDL